MESLSDTRWDVLISGTGLQNSLLALALSRSNKKILHVDENEYYGGAEAAFSLQQVDEWVKKVQKENSSTPFRNALLWKAEASEGTPGLSVSRAYTLTLSPQIIYSKTKLLSQLVTSKVYRQLEFQAVGNWWIYDKEADTSLRRLPNGREDISQDKSIDNRAKRSLMKFLKFVVDYENQTETWQPHADGGLAGFLSTQFKLSSSLQKVIAALTLAFEPIHQIPVKWALPRIARHLTSIGVFGPGFGAVVPKWGGGAEISQVACRAGAVGGAIYVLGIGAGEPVTVTEDGEELNQVQLSNGVIVKSRLLVRDATHNKLANPKVVSKIIGVVSSPLTSLFQSSVEGSPLAAVSVVVFPANSLHEVQAQSNPVYIMVHSGEAGECPANQCVLYATTLQTDESRTVLEAALAALLDSTESGEGKLLYSLYYEQEQQASTTDATTPSDASLDLAFDDEILQAVEDQWKSIMADENGVVEASFMQFDDREGMNEDEDIDGDDEY
ncbi:rab geranylgeranyl transferase escort protein-like protein [Stipitochalara longipes BDJ]|nr:rab geranylgeranyl transferase escort protein-like protein [Stipitochalara longipes BDJ]